jgi:hypothetical protein
MSPKTELSVLRTLEHLVDFHESVAGNADVRYLPEFMRLVVTTFANVIEERDYLRTRYE